MKALTVGEFKAKFAELLELVKSGEEIEILYGRAKEPVAMLVPIKNRGEDRKLGPWDGKAQFIETGSGKISEEEFLGLS